MRSFFVFDVSLLVGPITTVVFEISSFEVSATGFPVQLELRQVTGSVLAELQAGTGTSTFDDMVLGPLVADPITITGSEGSIYEFSLNAAGVAALTAVAGTATPFAFSGSLNNCPPTPATHSVIWSRSGRSTPRQLVVNKVQAITGTE